MPAKSTQGLSSNLTESLGYVNVNKAVKFMILDICTKKIVSRFLLGWSGGAKVSCISRHQGVKLILAYS